MTDAPDPILRPGDAASEEAQAAALASQALRAGPGLLSNVVEVMAGLAGLLTGRKVIAIQHLERPVEDRDNPGLGQWDSYARVMDQVDHDDEAAGTA